MWSSQLRTAVFIALYLSVATLAGCAATAPVQEMSDARQALRAAEQAGAQEKALPSYLSARQLLESAEALLLEGEYRAARRKADRARLHAVEARQQALGETP
jgi:outer membrane murein-binding lipoprotein Lpp